MRTGQRLRELAIESRARGGVAPGGSQRRLHGASPENRGTDGNCDEHRRSLMENHARASARTALPAAATGMRELLGTGIRGPCNRRSPQSGAFAITAANHLTTHSGRGVKASRRVTSSIAWQARRVIARRPSTLNLDSLRSDIAGTATIVQGENGKQWRLRWFEFDVTSQRHGGFAPENLSVRSTRHHPPLMHLPSHFPVPESVDGPFARGDGCWRPRTRAHGSGRPE